MLNDWLRHAAEVVQLGDTKEGLLGDEAITVLLDLARDSAHGVARPAAPLTGFVLGLAAGKTGADLAQVRALAARLAEAALKWKDSGGSTE